MDVKDLAVLVIEDDDSWIRTHEVMLGDAGFVNVDFADCKTKAVELLCGKKYNIILCDTLDAACMLMGPDVIEKARELGQKSVVVGLSTDSGFKYIWLAEVKSDYFFSKSEFYKKNCLAVVLREKFGIELKPAF